MNQDNTTGQPPLNFKGFKLAFKANEVCDLLSISRRSLTNLINRGLIRPSCGLRHHLFPLDEIKRYLNETKLEGIGYDE